MRPPLPLAALVALAFCGSSALAAVEIRQTADKLTVKIGGTLFTEYHFTGASHVYFYPLLGPGGAKMTRSWPMEDVPGEEHDHAHHRSLWFAHGDVDGVDFWTEAASYAPGKAPKTPVGKIQHEKFLKVEGGEKEGVIDSLNQWVAPDGRIALTSQQTVRFYDTGSPERMFDFEVTLTAGEQPVKMGDTKEGTMALRIAESMRLKAAKGQPAGTGHMINSEGIKDDEVWGKKAAWVDYAGLVEEKLLGIAVFECPRNPRAPTRWHARDYGLFAANPFCEHEMDKTTPAGAGALTIPAHESVTYRYRFLLHEGDAIQAKVPERFAEYVASTK